MLGGIGVLMVKESAASLGIIKSPEKSRKPARRHNPIIAALPMRWRFYRSGLYISPLAPRALGFFTGVLTVLLGDGRGFAAVPAMISLPGISPSGVAGTSTPQTLRHPTP